MFRDIPITICDDTQKKKQKAIHDEYIFFTPGTIREVYGRQIENKRY